MLFSVVTLPIKSMVPQRNPAVLRLASRGRLLARSRRLRWSDVCLQRQSGHHADRPSLQLMTRSGHSTSPSRCECCPYRPCLRSTAVVEASSLGSPRSRGRREWAQTPAPDVLDRLGAGCALTARFQPAPHSPLHDDGLWQCRAAAKSAKTSD
jgi:hypothetical protein